MQHLSDELLSAYADGELTPPEAVAAAAHLRTCAGCALTARRYAALDLQVASVPVLGCSAALMFVSAQLDGELTAEESTIAAAHLASCADCRADVLRWSVAEGAIAALPAARPSARVDAAIAALGQVPSRSRRPRVAWPIPVAAVAAAVSLLIVFNLSLGPSGPVGPNAAIVAAVQQSVLNSSNGTLYVLHPENGTVEALNAATLESRSVIHVGGKLTALALNETMTTLLVLDASAKTVTSIDCTLNSVSGSTILAVPGVPTSLQVDPSGNVVVTSVVAPAPGTPAKSAAPAGAVSVFKQGTNQLESVKQVEIAPQLVVLEPNGKRALLVSADATTLVDASSFQPLATAGGGLAAAFSESSDDFAILSVGAGGATVSFARRHDSIVVGGVPRAIVSMPGGGFGVLADSGGRGRVTILASDGTIMTALDVPADARELAYDPTARQFAVIAVGGVTNVTLPAAVAQVPPVTANATAPGTPLPTAKTTPQASPTASPTPAPTEPAAVVAPPERESLVPAGARMVWTGTYLVSVGVSKRPDRAIGDGSRIWYIDDSNRVSALNMTTGELFQIASLPATANVGRLAVSPNHVYLIDALVDLVYVVTISTERLTVVPLPFAAQATAIVASPDERLWIATNGFGLLSYDPRTARVETIAAGPNLSALASDPLGRIWIAAADRQAIDVYDPLNGRLTDLSLAHSGAITALIVDRAGATWIGTDTGQTFAIRNGSLVFSGGIGRPIDGFVPDQNGAASYVSVESGGLAYGSVASPAVVQRSPMGSSGPIFDAFGRVWQADRSAGGFYVTLPEGQR